MDKIEKTNVMRTLDQKKIAYIPHYYDGSVTDGMTIAETLGENPDSTYKTLVTVANTGTHYVFVVPVNSTLNLKRAAKAVGVKSVEMIKQKELLPLTGYIHGGCSPIGMKKAFRTVIHSSAETFPRICYSAGRVGAQVETSPQDLMSLIRATVADIADTNEKSGE